MAQNQGGETKRKKSRGPTSAKQPAGTLEVVPTGTIEPPVQTTALTVAVSDVRDEWEVQFSRFVPYPSPPIASTCSDLVILHPHSRNRRSRGRWISAASSALVRLAHDYSSSDVVLTVCFNEKILEEHYVSKLQFIWPQVSCMSGFPARGTRAVFVAYKDSFGKVQKFGLRFLSLHEAEEFMGALKEICNEGGDPEPLNTDVRSEVSAQSELTLFSRPANQACKNMTIMCAEEEYLTSMNTEKEDLTITSTEKEDLTTMTPADTYTPQISPGLLNNESDQYSHTQESVPMANFQSNFAALPPSFTSFLSNCGPVVEQAATQPTALQEADLKAQIARYMEDESFQDMLIQVEKVISEIGGDLMV